MGPRAKHKSEATRRHILDRALQLFRNKGFDETTMRDIAAAAELATGAAYYHFPSKEAIVMAYYEQVQGEHEERLRDCLDAVIGLRERLGIVIHTKLDILQNDRKLLGALFRFTGDPGHAASVFGAGTRTAREHSVAIFRSALEGEDLPDHLRPLLPTLLWFLHLGILLFFIYDNSPEQQRTRKITDGILDLLSQLLRLSSLPLVRSVLQPVQEKTIGLLREAGLVPEAQEGPARNE
jgi:AcrR family transcriptional regulator